MTFCTKVLAKFATEDDLKLTVGFDVSPDGGVFPQKVDETKAAPWELGLDDDVEVK